MRLLIVDDSKAMRTLIIRTVRSAGYANVAIEEATNGAEALAAVRASPPDLVLTDWNMPEMSGIEFVEAVRAGGCSVPVGFVTSERNPNILERAHQAGALFVLAKPFTPDGFREALAKAM
ncbi:MAG TPA: response regulator [Anaeromyxobacteraceae bacterium]|nr:response regulator [Anaeromyxobacteraceae bacterium]